VDESTVVSGFTDKPLSDICFNDWKRFCFVLREIANGKNGRPLSGLDAQKRARAVLNECGYAWSSGIQVRGPEVIHRATLQSPNLQTPKDSEHSFAGTKRKGVGKPGQRADGAIGPQASIASLILQAAAPRKLATRCAVARTDQL
jgi:hypothetical protein